MQTVTKTSSPKRSELKTQTYSLAEFAALMGIGYTKAQEMVQAGTLPVTPIKIGRTYKFPRAAVHRLLCIDTENDQDAA